MRNFYKIFYSLLMLLLLLSCSNSKIITNREIETEKKVLSLEIPHDSLYFSNRLQLKPESIRTPIRIIATGDLMLGTIIPKNSYILDNPGLDLFDLEIQEILRSGDITFGNLEGTVSGITGIPKKKKYVFAMEDNSAELLAYIGYNLLSTANNHALDMGFEGKQATKLALMKSNIYFAGYTDVPTTEFEINNVSYGFIAVSPNYGVLNIHKFKKIIKIVTELKSSCNIVIVSMHIGAEGQEHQHITRKQEYFLGEDRGNPYLFAREMIDAGADVILGHGPHVTRAIDLYKDRFIAYSLGNFCTANSVNIKDVSGVAPIVDLIVDIDGSFISGKIHSTKQIHRKGVSKDPDSTVLKLIQKLTSQDFPESMLTINDDGIIYKSTSN